jgi:hypothetical protein
MASIRLIQHRFAASESLMEDLADILLPTSELGKFALLSWG